MFFTGVSSATAANQGVPPARAIAIALKTKPAATGPIPANGTKREASNRSSSIVPRPSSEDNGGEHDQAGGGGGRSWSGEESVSQGELPMIFRKRRG